MNSSQTIHLSSCRCASAGFVSLFAFFLESFAHVPVVGKLEPRSIPAGQLTGGGASVGCRAIIGIGTAIAVAVSAAVISTAIAVAVSAAVISTAIAVAVSAAVISTAISTPLNSAVDASNATGC
jgi:hypothetical protein